MSRFRNLSTGSIVNVSDESSTRYQVGYEALDRASEKSPAKKAAPRKRAAKKNN